MNDVPEVSTPEVKPRTTAAVVLPLKPRSNAREKELWSDVACAVAMVGDTAMVFAGLACGFWLRFRSKSVKGVFDSFATNVNSTSPQPPDFSDYYKLFIVGMVFFFATFLYLKAYQKRNLLRFRRVARLVVKGSVFWLLAFLGASLAFLGAGSGVSGVHSNPQISRGFAILAFACVCIFLLAWRRLYHRVLHWDRLIEYFQQRVLFVGWNQDALRLVEGIESDASRPYSVAGSIEGPTGAYAMRPPKWINRLGGCDDLKNLVDSNLVDIVVLADLEAPRGEIIGLSNFCERELIQFKVLPSYFQIMVSGLHLETISGVPILGVSDLPLDHMWNRILKRSIDIVGALVGLALSMPLMILFGLLIYFESPGPIFYRQLRTGRNGRGFEIIKLRSMRLDAEKGGAQWAKKGDDRRLKIGAFLREWNLDELPQFWNVLKGQMTLVGPRPERPELIAKFQYEIPHYNARLASKPGMTGWAQIHGLRGDTDLGQRVRYDLYYLENWSVWLDFQIMVQTFIRRENAY